MKNHRGLKIFGIVALSVVLFFVIINVIPPKKNVDENPFIVGEGKLPMIAAHRGGGENNPENTMLAFREAVNTIGVDIIESDLYLTKDGYLVYNHDGYIDRTSNVNGDVTEKEVLAICGDKQRRHYIKDMTLAELEEYNFGYFFKDENGERIYKDETDIEGAGLQIATVDELFSEFYESHPDLYRGAPTGTAAAFILTQFLGVNIFDGGDFACLQIPMSYDLGIEINLESKSIINRAHRRNIAVQYWTINDPDEMRRLIELGCDCIMTDNPKLLKEVLEEYK